MKPAFSDLHPFVLFVYYAVVVIFCMLFFHPVFLFSSFLIMIWVNLISGTGRRLLRLGLFYLLSGLVLAAVNPLLSHRGEHIIWYWFDRPVTLESIVYGITMMFSILTIVLAFLSYQHIVTSDKLLYVFSVGSPQFALLLMMTIRFIPLFKRRLFQIVAVQRTRGIDATNGSWKKRINHAMRQMQVLLTMCLEEALQTADSMKARGYGLRKRTTYIPYRINTEDRWFLLILIGFTALSLSGWFFGLGKLDIYPELHDMHISGSQWWVYTCFCLTIGAPLLIEGRERWQWRYCK